MCCFAEHTFYLAVTVRKYGNNAKERTFTTMPLYPCRYLLLNDNASVLNLDAFT